jgi:rhodanese-related sulfurtransferase
MKEYGSRKEDISIGEVFKELPQEKWDELTRAAEHRTVAPHTIIFRQGDPGDKFYIIQSGKVRVFRKGHDGFERELSVLESGASFGQLPLLTGEAGSVSMESLEETHLIMFSKEQFEAILRNYPDISLAFMKQMSRWLLRANKVFEREVMLQRRTPRTSWFHFVLIIGVAVLLALLFNESNPNGLSLFPKSVDKKAIPMIKPAQAMEEFKKGNTLIVDAGPEGFYQRKHIREAINVPLSLSDILFDVTFEGDAKTKKVIVYGGTFSKHYDWELADKFLHKGLKDVRVLEGGVTAWEKAGFPVDIWEEKK